jgi:hypothetical protein
MAITIRARRTNPHVSQQGELFGPPEKAALKKLPLVEVLPSGGNGQAGRNSVDEWRNLLSDASYNSGRVKNTTAYASMARGMEGLIVKRADLLRDSVVAISNLRGKLEQTESMLALVPEKPEAEKIAGKITEIRKLSGDILEAAKKKGWNGRGAFNIRVRAAEIGYLCEMWLRLSNGNLIGLVDYYEKTLPRKKTLAARNMLKDNSLRSIVEVTSGFCAVQAITAPKPSGKSL